MKRTCGSGRPFLGGFSLVETLFSALLVCVLAFVALSLYPTSLLGMKKGHDLVVASQVAQGRLDSLLAVPFGHLDDLTATHPDLRSGSEVVDGTEFRYQVTVHPGSSPRLRHLQVVVTWISGARNSRSAVDQVLSYETVRFRFDQP